MKNLKKTAIFLFLIFGIILFGFQNVIISAKNGDEKEYCTAVVEDEFDDNEIIVTLKNEESLLCKTYTIDDFSYVQCINVIDLCDSYNGTIRKQLSNEYVKKQIDLDSFNRLLKLELNVHSKENVLNCIKILEQKDYVKSATPNFETSIDLLSSNVTSYTNDEYSYQQWGIGNIELDSVWENYSSGSSDVVVGIIDTGIDGTNPDLIGKVNEELSVSFVSNSDDPLVDEDGHGTGVAGVIAAEHNNYNVIAGVCENITLVSLKIPDTSSSHSLNIAACVEYAFEKEIDVLNISWGCDKDSALKESLENFPGLIVCAAGNDGANIDGSFDPSWVYPAKYTKELDNIISVGASNNNNNRWINSQSNKSSNYSDNGYVDIFAPGSNIYTIKSTQSEGYSNQNNFDIYSGTSFAAPYVTGVIALMLSYHPGVSNQVIKNAIYNGASALNVEDGEILCTNNRRLNAYGAFQQFHAPANTYVCENSTYHSVICGICNCSYLEEHIWVPDSSNINRAIITPIRLICSKCGINQI